MKLCSLVSLFLACQATAVSATRHQKNAAFFLAGDSTTAIKGGWGNGFITTITNGSFGINYGVSGATTASFRAQGRWDTVLASVKKARKLGYSPFVTIQFGHNDQKEASNISIELFTHNLEIFSKDVIAAGGTPVLTTSLTRRAFSLGKVIENLAQQANATIYVAKSLGVPYIDLNRASTDYINKIGATLADTYNLTPDDRTHLNPYGELLFGTLVSVLIGRTLDQGRWWTKPNVTIARALSNGTYILPTPLPGTTNSTAPLSWYN
ncbi:putative gdsl-like lipase acylhydrolase protein [Diplocarpon rosae]|nr:putative gdsl-like lipase acylhydrolase protein [Diplocarpon rosae]